MLKPTFQDYVEQNVHFRSTCNDTIFVKKTRNKKTLMMSNKMLKTHLSRWCWTKCSFPINFVSNSCCLHSPLFSSAHSRSTWANKINESVWDLALNEKRKLNISKFNFWADEIAIKKSKDKKHSWSTWAR